MKAADFTTTILVDQTPKQVFDAINNPRGWWSEEIEGNTEQLNEVFDYHFRDIHICKMKLIEFLPEKKVVWLVLDNYFNFIKDQGEWKGTKIIFEISSQDNKTKLHFMHQGLVPAYECFDICKNAWTQYIQESLYNLITTGKGQPNNRETQGTDYSTTITVDATASQAFNSVNNVAQWWTENLEGSSHNLNDEFSVRFGDVHYSKQKLVEFIPDKKLAWLVTDSRLNFIEDRSEWTGTKITFEIFEKNHKTHVRFTQQGLIPEIECYDACSNAWSEYIHGSLRNLINTGKGHPATRENKAKAKVK